MHDRWGNKAIMQLHLRQHHTMIARSAQKNWFRAIVKRFTPYLSRSLIGSRIFPLIPLLEIYLAMLQGKGAGSGWDLHAETKVAAMFIHRPDAVVFDVGANKGEWSLGLLKALGGEHVQFFLFEPAVSCQQYLQALNLPKVTYINAALGAKVEHTILYSPMPSSPLASMYQRNDSFVRDMNFTQERITVTTIDQIVREHDIALIDYLKLDIEGNEIAALQGAQATLKAGRIKALAFEFGSGNVNSRTYFRDFWELLVPLGYEIKRIGPGGRLIPIDQYSEVLEYFRGATNYVAILQESQPT